MKMLGCKKSALIRILVLIAVFFSCENKPVDAIVYKKPLDEKLDSTCKWLKQNTHFHTDNYMPVFYLYYQSKIEKQDYGAASKAMEIVSDKKIYFSTYDKRFTDTLQSFSKKYSNKIPASTTTYINSYLGSYTLDQGNFKKAIYYHSKNTAIDVTDYKSCIEKAYAYFDIAFCYFSMGDQNRAQTSSLKALEYFNKTDSFSGRASVYTNLGSINMATKNYEKSNAYYDKAIEYFVMAKDTGNILNSMYNKIHTYEESNDKRMFPYIDHTYKYFKKSKSKDQAVKIAIYTYYTKKLLAENKIGEAKKILDEIQPEVVALNLESATQDYNLAIAEFEIKKNNGIVNLNTIKSSLPILKENENYQIIRSYYDILKQDALARRDYKNALLYEEELQKASDSIGSREMRNKVIELDKRYQVEKKEQQIELQEKTILNKNTSIALLISVLFAFFLTAIVLTTKQKQKKLKLEKQNALLYTRRLLEKTEEERKRIASDLHDSVSHELLSLKNSTEGKTEAVNKKIDSILNDIRSISRNLHPVMFEKIGLKASVEQLVERAQSVNDFMVTADIEYNGSFLNSSEELQLYRIIQESLSNIIKYSQAMAAKISLSESQNLLKIEIKDNGKGFDVADTLAKKDAFGIHNIIERSRAIGGEVKILSNKTGTIITIEIRKTT